MLENLFFMFTEPISNDLLGWSCLIGIWICFLFILILILYVFIYIINFSFRPKQTGYGIIVNKTFTAAYSTTIYVNNFPQIINHDDNWCLTIEINGKTDEFSLPESEYNKLNVGNKLTAVYTTGRLYNSINIKAITY